MASVRQRTNRDLGRENGQGQAEYYVASYLGKDKRTSRPTMTRERPTTERHVKSISWQKLSLVLINLLSCSHCVLAFVGSVVECTLNFFALNGSLWTRPWRIFHFNELVFPKEGKSNYHTLIWQLDPRTKLYTDTSASAKAHSTKTDTDCFPVKGTRSRRTLDVTIMASKLAYENRKVVQKVVEKDWEMHFLGFYTCSNGYYKSRSTEVFIFADEDFNAIFIAWRGTEPFNTSDWSTDIDFSWAKFQDGMAVHLGFLEALGLCRRDKIDTFTTMDSRAREKSRKPTEVHKRTKQEIKDIPPTSGLSKQIREKEKLAYDYITKKVANLLYEYPRAQLFVTGHSLGGALAALYGVMLYYNNETEITNNLAGIYTFGQPRVGNKKFADYAQSKLGRRYKRVVYCNDIIPRVPFDNKWFQFKHFGKCYYYDNWYNGWILPEEPKRNFFGSNCITLRITAVCELIQCIFILPCRYGPEYKESVVSILARLAGIIIPEVVAHSPRNYVNAVRLGPCPLSQWTQKNLFQTLRSVIFCLLTLVACSLGYYLYGKL